MRNKRMSLRDKFHQIFAEEAEKRPERFDLTWVEAEATTMCAAVNSERSHRGKQPITHEQFERMHVCCQGHCDYHSKLALVCM